jgi:hypothetical protein
MDKLDTYRQYIKNLLIKRVSIKPANSNLESHFIFDTERDHYQVINYGWRDETTRIYSCSVHVNIQDDKIWIQHNGSEIALADQLAELGVPKQDIVLAYHAPHVRQYTEFAAG